MTGKLNNPIHRAANRAPCAVLHARGVRLSVAGVLLAGSALAPLHAQTFDIGGGPLVVSDIEGPPLNGPTAITNGTLEIDTAAVLAPYTGTLSDSFGIFNLIKSGTGTVTLSGNNTYTGTTTVNNGILALNGGSAIGDASSLIMNGGTLQVNTAETVGALSGTGGTINSADGVSLTVNQATNTVFSGSFAGTGGLSNLYLEKRGSGTLTLNGTNTGTGNRRMLVTGGVLELAGSNAVGDQNILEASNSGTIRLINSETIGALLGNANGTINLGGQTLTIAGVGSALLTFNDMVVEGSGVLRIAHPGSSAQMTGAHTFTGLYQVSNGILALGGTGSASASLLVDGGVLNLLANRTFSTATLSSGSITGASTLTSTSTFDVRSGNISPILAGSVGLTKTTAGTVTLSGANTYTGLTAIDAGTLIAANNTALGSAAGGTLVADGATLGLQGGITIGEPITLNGSGVGGNGALRNISGNNTITGSITLGSAATIRSDAGNVSVNGAIDNGGHLLTVSGAGSTGLNGNISGSGGILANSAFAVFLAGTNSYTGTTTLESGGLVLTGGSTISDTGRVVVNAGILAIANDETIGSLEGTGGSISTTNNPIPIRLTVGGNNLSTTYAGNLGFPGSDRLGLGKIGFGTLTLTGNNTHSGGTTIDFGTLQIGNGGTTGTLGSGDVVNNATLEFNRSNAITAGNIISGLGRLTQQGTGTLTLSGVNTYTGGTTINAGTIVAGNESALGFGNIVFNADGAKLVADFDGTLILRQTSGGFTSTRNLTFEDGVDATFAAATGRTVRFEGGLVLRSGATARFGSATETGVIEWGVRGSIGTASLASVVIDGGTLRLADQAFLFDIVSQGVQSTTINANAVLDLSGNAIGVRRIAGTGTILNSGAASTLSLFDSTFAGTFDTGAGGITLAGDLAGAAALTKRGAGTLTLNATLNTTGFTGGFNLAEGTLSLQGNLASSFGTITTTGSVIDYASGITNAAPIAINSNTTQLQVLAGSAVQSGVISELGGARGFAKTGAGTLILTGDNSYTGTTTISAGALQIGNGGTTGTLGSGNVVNNAALVFNRSGDITAGNIISGSGSLTKQASGTLTLTGANTYSGTTTISDGTLQIGNGGTGGALGSGDVLNDAALVFDRSDAITASNNISGAGSLTQKGAGTLTLSGANTYRGGTSVTGGTLLVTGSLSSAVTVDGAVLGGTGRIARRVAINSGGTLAAGLGAGTLTMDSLALNAGSTTIFELGQAGVAGGANNDLVRVTGNLELNGGAINIVQTAGFGAGQYTLFEFGSLAGALGNLALDPLGNGFLGSLALGTGEVLLNAAAAADLVWWNGSVTSPTGAVAGGDGTWSLGGGNFTTANGTVSGPWAGNGALAVFGGAGGTVTIAPGEMLSPAGLNFVSDGYIITGGDAAAGLALTGPTGIDTLAGVGATIAATISGAGSLTKTGAGTLTLTGANSYAGPTSVLGGTLAIGASGSLAGDVVAAASFVNAGSVAGALTVNNGGAADNSASGQLLGSVAVNSGGSLANAGTVAGAVSNAGTLTNSGAIAGGVTNSAALTSTGTLGAGLVNNGGATAQIAGVLAGTITNNGAITLTGATTGIGAVVQSDTGVFDLVGNSTAFGSLAGSGSVALGAGTLTVGSSNADTQFTGVISGSGGLTKVGTGVLTLRRANNTFTGLTTIDAGLLLLDFGGTLAGGVVNNAVFVNNGGIAGGLVVNNGSLSSLNRLGGGLLNNAGARAVLGGSIMADIANAGEVVLNDGFGQIGAFTQTATGVFDLTRANTTIGSLAGSGSVLLGARTLTLGGNNASTSFAGVIAGTGGLTKTGTGTFTLTGANTYTGLTTISGGTLAIAQGGSLAGGVLNNATLSNAGSIAGAVTNAGVLTNSGTMAGLVTNGGTLISTGTLGAGLINNSGATAQIAGVLTGAVSNEGTLTLTGPASGIGALSQGATGVFDLAGNNASISSLAGAGSVLLGAATLTAGSDNTSTSFAGVIAGAGGLTKAGAGTLTLTGANTYTGTTTISAGALQLGDGAATGAIIGPVVNNGALVINRSDAVLLANAISGTGMLVQDGAGTTTLAAANTHTGGTLVSRGRLVGDTQSLQGAITNNAALAFTMAADGTFAGTLAGSGMTEKTGAGILTFAGDGRALTGPFAVLGGGLRLTGRLDASVVTLAPGTVLSGNGTLGGLVVGEGALVSPGNSIGTLAVAGDITFAPGSRYLAEVTQTGADLITASGAAQLAGALDIVNIGTEDYTFNTAFAVLEAAGGITGSFDAVSITGFGPMFRPTLRSGPNGLDLVLAPSSLSVLAGAGLTGNQAAVAARFDAAVLAGVNPQAFLGVYDLPQAQLPAALDQLSGEVHAAMGRAAMRQSRLPREAVLERAAGVALPGIPQGNTLGGWGKVMRSWGDVASQNGTAAQDIDTEGFVIGFDGGSANDARSLRFGVYGSYLNTRVGMDARASNGQIEQAGGGVYASAGFGGLSLVAGGGAARFDMTTNRTLALPGLAGATSTASAGDMAQVFGRIGYRLDLGAASLEPFVAGDAAWIALDEAAERGGAAALVAGRQEYNVASTSTGLAAKLQLGQLRLDAEGAARFELGDRDPQALIALAAAPGAASRIAATRLAGTAFTGRLGAVLPITSRIEVRVDYAGEFSATDTQHTAQAGLSIAF